MTTLEPEQKDILEKLNEIALETNWGTIERVNGVPKAVAVIQEAMEEIKRLREQNNDLYDFKRKLEDELIKNGFAEYADDKFKTLTDYKTEIEQIRKETIKEIYTALIKEYHGCLAVGGEIDENYLRADAKYYGVEIKENE